MGNRRSGGLYKPPQRVGDPMIVCDQTGFVVPRSQTTMQWNGLVVWNKTFDTRQPQDIIPPYKDQQTFPNSRPMQEPTFLQPNEVSRDDL